MKDTVRDSDAQFLAGSVSLGDADLEALVESLVTTGQNLYGQTTTTSQDWADLETLLAVSAGTDLEVFAYFGSDPCSWEGPGGAWQVDGNPNDSCSLSEEEAILNDAFAAVAVLGLDYSNLVGFSIDDFATSVQSALKPTGQVSTSDFALAVNNAKALNPDLQFWPVVYYKYLGMHFADGYTVGAGYGTSFPTGSSVALTLHFNEPVVGASSDPEIRLRFAESDVVGTPSAAYAGLVYKEVVIDGTTVLSTDLVDNDYLDLFDEDISCYLTPGSAHTVEFRVRADGSLGNQPNSPLVKLMFLWGIELEVSGEDLFAGGRAYLSSPTSLPAGHISGSNAPYSLEGVIDGVVAFYHASTRMYDETGYRTLVEMADNFVGSKTFLAAHYSGAGTNWSYGYDPSDTAEMLTLDARVADGLIVWNLPNAIAGLDEQLGVFHERQSHSSSFDLMAFWPSHQVAYPGWFQRWDSPSLGGSATVRLYDRDDRYMVVRFLLNGDPDQVLYEDSTGGTFCSASTSSPVPCPGVDSGLSCELTCDGLVQVLDFSLPTTDDTISAEVELNASFGNTAHWVFLGVPSPSSWVYSSGVGEEFEALYESVLDTYWAMQVDSDTDGVVDCNDECPDDPLKAAEGSCGCGVADTDSDGDGTPDCTDMCPRDPDRIDESECGCGAPSGDTDRDGVIDCMDECPFNPALTAPGPCGCLEVGLDSDRDGVLDCADECPDDPRRSTEGICPCGERLAWIGTDGPICRAYFVGPSF